MIAALSILITQIGGVDDAGAQSLFRIYIHIRETNIVQ
jgi:hypothetical protein